MLMAITLRLLNIVIAQPFGEFIDERRKARLNREMHQLPDSVQRDVGWPPREEVRR